MNKSNLEILGLSEGATLEDVKSAYETLRAKYLEERFMDGEVGNNAARMLTKIETAYSELMKELSESAPLNGGNAGEETGGESVSSFSKVEELLKKGDYDEAQRVLDSFNERNAEWHYLQSFLFFKKNWMNESKKQLEIAMQLDPESQKYKEAYRKLKSKMESDTIGGADTLGNPSGFNPGSSYNGATMDSNRGDRQMGGDGCATCLDCCTTYLCLSCLCDSCR